MKKTYIISGMTCDSCKSTILQNLNELQEIEAVEVDRDKGEAIIFMTNNIQDGFGSLAALKLSVI